MGPLIVGSDGLQCDSILGVCLLPSLHGSFSCNFPRVIYDRGGKATFEIHERYTGE